MASKHPPRHYSLATHEVSPGSLFLNLPRNMRLALIAALVAVAAAQTSMTGSMTGDVNACNTAFSPIYMCIAVRQRTWAGV